MLIGCTEKNDDAFDKENNILVKLTKEEF